MYCKFPLINTCKNPDAVEGLAPEVPAVAVVAVGIKKLILPDTVRPVE